MRAALVQATRVKYLVAFQSSAGDSAWIQEGVVDVEKSVGGLNFRCVWLVSHCHVESVPPDNSDFTT